MPRKTFRKIITSPENWEKVNPKNKKLIDQFLKEKNTRSSDATLVGYRSDLEIFFTWNSIFNENKFFVDIKKLEFSDFFSYVVEELHWGSARFGRMKSVLSTLSIFLEKYFDTDFPNFRNVILKVIENMPKNATREKTVLKEEQVNFVFETLKSQEEWQILCWFSLAVASGARFAELLRFTTDILDENHLAFNDIFLETLKPVKSKGRSKTGKLTIKFVIKDLFLDNYKKWLEVRKEIMGKNGKEHNSIFIKSNGDPAEEGSARTWVSKIEDILQVPFYPHALRHYLVSYLVKLGISYELIKELIGWENVLMCSVYDDTSARDKEWKELDGFQDKINAKK